LGIYEERILTFKDHPDFEIACYNTREETEALLKDILKKQHKDDLPDLPSKPRALL